MTMSSLMTSSMPAVPLGAVMPVRLVAPERGADLRGVPARVQHVAAGIVERHRQAEGLALLDLGDALFDFGGGDLVHAAELVVAPVVAPRRLSGRRFQRFCSAIVSSRRAARCRGSPNTDCAPILSADTSHNDGDIWEELTPSHFTGQNLVNVWLDE